MSKKKLHYGVRLTVDQLRYLKTVGKPSEWIRAAVGRGIDDAEALGSPAATAAKEGEIDRAPALLRMARSFPEQICGQLATR